MTATTPNTQELNAMQAKAAKFSDEKLAREIEFASDPGEDEYAVAWKNALWVEQATRDLEDGKV